MGQEASAPGPAPPAIAIPPVPSQTYLHHTTLAPRPKLVLIGDSITEQGSSHAQGWVASLAIRYNRRMDVINRGANGYNSRWGTAALPWILEDILGPSAAGEAVAECVEKDASDVGMCQATKPKVEPDSDGDEGVDREPAAKNDTPHPHYTFMIGYGANDSCLPDGAHSRHHVPLEEYSSNLKQMVKMIQTWNAEKNVAVALLTPPPCDTEVQKASRDNENVTKLYAEACIQVATEMSVPVVDLWRGMQLPISKNIEDQSTFESTRQWKTDYLSDGLHLSPIGNYRLYELVIEVLDRSMVEEERGLGLAVTKLPRAFPDHSTVGENSFGTDEE